MSTAPTSFIDEKTKRRIKNAVVHCQIDGQWKVFIITDFTVTEACALGIGQGREVTQLCTALSDSTGKEWVQSGARPISVPEPTYCSGCGRKLDALGCPFLLNSGMKSHITRSAK